MGTRSNKPDPRSFENNAQYTLADSTPELQRLEQWKPDSTLFNAGVQSGFDRNRRDITESYNSPYSGISNPYTKARMQTLSIQDAEGQRASALGDQDAAYQKMGLEPLLASAQLRQGDRLKTKEWGIQPGQNQPGFGSQLLQGGLSILGGLL
jgi:hypothetical protein